MKVSPSFLSAILFTLCSSLKLSVADSTFPEFTLHGLVDLRYQHTAAQPSWTDNGLGKFRSGGENNRFLINEGAVTLQTRLGWDWTGTVTAKYSDGQKNPLDLTEAFLQYRPVSTTPWRLGGRLGMFFPPISLENTGTAWSSPYTLTSSVINTWVGEELRTFGGEAHLSYQFDNGDSLGAFAAGLAHNDTTGSLLAWRGWSLHDYEATLNDRLALPENIGIGTHFPQQALMTKPFVEVDGRPGYYAGFNAEHAETIKFRTLFYDNQSNPETIANGQYAWHTQFLSTGLKVELPWQLTLVSQGINGRTRMGEKSAGKRAVDARFWAASLLLSKTIGTHRFSLRHDHFGIDENDFLPQDSNRENGQGWTANYNLTLAQRHQMNFEVTYLDSNRAARTNLNQSSKQEETLWQISYRLFF